MFLCQVTGSVVATRKQEAFRPAKLLVVHRVDQHGALVPEAKEMLALDPRFGGYQSVDFPRTRRSLKR